MSSRSIPIALVNHLKQPATTTCFLLKIIPRQAEMFGITSLDRDVIYDDGSVVAPTSGFITYRAKRGYTPSDQVASADLSVDNGEAAGLLAEYPMDGVTMAGIARGDYDGAKFVQYLVNYEDLSNGHVIINSGTIGEVTQLDDLTCQIELRSLTQTLKQNSVIELTSITCRAKFGDERCKLSFEWHDAAVTSVGAESDRVFAIDAVPPDFVLPGVVQWLTGANAGRTYEIEEYDAVSGDLTLVFPTGESIETGDTLQIRRDCDKSKAMCIGYANYLNFRGEPELPRANGTDLQAPTPGS